MSSVLQCRPLSSMNLCLFGISIQSILNFFKNCLSCGVAFTVQQVFGLIINTLTALTVSSAYPTQSCNHVSTKSVNSVLSSSPGNHQLFLIRTLCAGDPLTLLRCQRLILCQTGLTADRLDVILRQRFYLPAKNASVVSARNLSDGLYESIKATDS